MAGDADRAELFVSLALQTAARRKRRGWTQQTLADEAGLERGTVARIEQARRMPSVPVLVALADALGCSTDALLERGRR